MHRALIAIVLAAAVAASVSPQSYSECKACEDWVNRAMPIFQNPILAQGVEQALVYFCTQETGHNLTYCQQVASEFVGTMEIIADLAAAGKLNATKLFCVQLQDVCPAYASNVAMVTPQLSCARCQKLVEIAAPMLHSHLPMVNGFIKVGCQKAGLPQNACEIPLQKVANSLHLELEATWSKRAQYGEWVCRDKLHICPA